MFQQKSFNVLPLPIDLDNIYIYPLSPARLEKSFKNDLVGDKVLSDDNLKSVFSDRYIQIKDGLINFEFECPKTDSYYITIFSNNFNPYNSNIKISINNKKGYNIFDKTTNHIVDNWLECPLTVYNYINNTHELTTPVKLVKGSNVILIELEDISKKDILSNFDFIVISTQEYYKTGKSYYPNINNIYLAPSDIELINLEERGFKDNSIIYINENKYELKVDRNSYTDSKPIDKNIDYFSEHNSAIDKDYPEKTHLSPISYKLYYNDMEIMSDITSHVSLSLIGIIKPNCNDEYLNQKFDIELAVFGETIGIHTRYDSNSDQLLLKRKSELVRFLGIKERINLNDNWKMFYVTMNDLFLTEKIKIGRKLNII